MRILPGESRLIVIQEVSRRFGTHQAVDGVSLTIDAGQIFGIIGPNGAGKSTLFRMICQLIPPDSGSISVNGVTDEIGIKRQIGYLPEEHRLYEHLRTLDYLYYFCDLLGVPRRRGRDVLEKVGLAHKAADKISKLSKGMRQKIAFARTLLGDPPVLILDEPMYGLDPHTSQEMRSWILHEAQRKVVVMSSHNLHEAERVCDRVAILHRGKVVACAPPRVLIEEMKREHILEVGFRGSDAPIRRAVGLIHSSRPPVYEANLVRLYFPRSQDPYLVLQEILGAIQQVPETIQITGITPREATLEDVFLKLTGEAFVQADVAGAAAAAVPPGEAP